MRKFWLVLLAAGAIATLAACSDEGDDTKKPVSPVTEVKVPATGEIGGAFEITGKGFDSSAQISLKSTSGTETAVEDLEVSATSAKFNIPSTLTAGIYTVVLKQNGSWELGTVRLSVAEMPILNLGLPSVIKLNKPLEINGIGFTSASKIFLETADAAKTRTELTTTLGSSGVNCTIPSSVKAGAYNVVLKHNNIDWTLGEKIEAAVYKRLVGVKEVFASMTDISDFDAIVAAAAPENPIHMYIKELGAEEFKKMLTQSNMEIASSQTFVFNNDGQLTTMIKNDGEKEAPKIKFTYNGNIISGETLDYDTNDGEMSFDLTVGEGRVDGADIKYKADRSSKYDFSYNTDGRFTGMLVKPSNNPYKTFVYTDGNLTQIDQSILPVNYTAESRKTHIFGVDVAIYLMPTIDMSIRISSVLGILGKPSAMMPATITGQDMATGMEKDYLLNYVLDNDGYATSVTWGDSGTDMFGFPSSTTYKREFIYE